MKWKTLCFAILISLPLIASVFCKRRKRALKPPPRRRLRASRRSASAQMSPYADAIGAAYAATLLFGVPGNAWVVSSVMRSRRPRSASALTPSDRLRTYIGLLGVIDLCVMLVLAIRAAYLFLPNATITTKSCQVVFIIAHLTKLTSLSCLMCISVERYITIRKPFRSRVRKWLIQMTPLLTLLQLTVITIAIGILSTDVAADPVERRDCVRVSSVFQSPAGRNATVSVAGWTLAVGFLFQLLTVSISYGQIVRHVRRKFWQRKARVVANTHLAARKPLIVTEPRYMKDMTAAIVRVACFHVVCLLPYCVMQALPDAVRLSVDGAPPSLRILNEHAATALRLFDVRSRTDILAWLALVADWLIYINSASNWIFYAAMNRDLRSIIRATTERRKRSTMSQHSPSTMHRSLRRQMTQSLRFFYSINSYRSNANSLDESCSTVQNQPLTGSVSGRLLIGTDSPSTSPPAVPGCQCHHGHHAGHKCSTALANGAIATEGHFGMRNGRAHTYCSPRTSQRDNVRLAGEYAILKMNDFSSGKGKQIFFPATGISSKCANGVSPNIMTRLATTRKTSATTPPSQPRPVDTDADSQRSSGGRTATTDEDVESPAAVRPIFSRIFILSAIRMLVAIAARVSRSNAADGGSFASNIFASKANNGVINGGDWPTEKQKKYLPV